MPDRVLDRAPVRNAIADVERRLNGRGRLVIRKSGTEPLIRIMAEGDDSGEVTAVVAGLVDCHRQIRRVANQHLEHLRRIASRGSRFSVLCYENQIT